MTAPNLWAAYERMDRALGSAGFATTPPFWSNTIEAFYRHPTARTLVGQVGRGGAKSTHAVKMAVCETIFGNWRIPPGERHVFAFVSESVSEAHNRLYLIESYLQALGVPFSRKEDTISIDGMPLGFRVFASRIGAVSGFRCIGCSLDEVAKWSNDGVNPAPEVWASLNATMITHPEARSRIISSPMARQGFHFDRVMLGTSEHQIVACAPSWVANPDGISEAETRRREPDERLWRREYLAEPGEGQYASLDSEQVRSTKQDLPLVEPISPSVFALDASGGSGDSFVWCRAQWLLSSAVESADIEGTYVYWPSEEPGKMVLSVSAINGLDGTFKDAISLDQIVDHVAQQMHACGARHVVADPYMGPALEVMFRKHGIRLVSQVWSVQSKADALQVLRRWLREGTLAIEATAQGDQMRDELIRLQTKVLPSGNTTTSARTGHDDRAALILNLAMMQASLSFPGGPGVASRRARRFGPGDFANAA